MKWLLIIIATWQWVQITSCPVDPINLLIPTSKEELRPHLKSLIALRKAIEEQKKNKDESNDEETKDESDDEEEKFTSQLRHRKICNDDDDSDEDLTLDNISDENNQENTTKNNHKNIEKRELRKNIKIKITDK